MYIYIIAKIYCRFLLNFVVILNCLTLNLKYVKLLVICSVRCIDYNIIIIIRILQLLYLPLYSIHRSTDYFIIVLSV